MGFGSDTDAVHVSFWNWMAMSLVCLYFPRHFVIAIPRMLFDSWYCVGQLCAIDSMSGIIWLIYSAKQHSLIFQSILSACCFWTREAYLSLFWFDCGNMIQRWKLISISKSVFELYLCYQTRNSAPVIGFVFSASLEWCVISALLDLFHCYLHHKEARSH